MKTNNKQQTTNNKQRFLLKISAFLLVFLITNCQNQPDPEPVGLKSNKATSLAKSASPYSTITKVNGILKFTSNAHLQQTLDYMENEYEGWNDAFESQ